MESASQFFGRTIGGRRSLMTVRARGCVRFRDMFIPRANMALAESACSISEVAVSLGDCARVALGSERAG
jgi:hypothetical protein